MSGIYGVEDWEINTHGHIWQKDDDGSINIFAFESGNHNGPVCIKCGYSFCHHCQDKVDQECQLDKKETEL